MVEQREKVLNEVNRYATMCDRIQNNLANESNTVISIKKLNHKLAIKHRDRGYLGIIWKQIRNVINKHKIIWTIVLFFALMLVFAIIASVFNTIMMRVGSGTVPVVSPFLVTLILVLCSWKPTWVPMINLAEDEKTTEYKNLENSLMDQRRELNQSMSQYQAFFSNAIISGFITEPNAISAPTYETDGNFTYPFVSDELKQINSYMQKHQADTIHEASMLYTQQLAYQNQVESNEQIIANTADAAEYSRQAANSARSAAFNSAANMFNNIFRD